MSGGDIHCLRPFFYSTTSDSHRVFEVDGSSGGMLRINGGHSPSYFLFGLRLLIKSPPSAIISTVAGSGTGFIKFV